MDKKIYLLDGEPVSARGLIKMARSIDSDFATNWLQQTSVAAGILRNSGYIVADNPDV